MLNFAKISFVICKLFAIISFAIGSENDPEFRKKTLIRESLRKNVKFFGETISDWIWIVWLYSWIALFIQLGGMNLYDTIPLVGFTIVYKSLTIF